VCSRIDICKLLGYSINKTEAAVFSCRLCFLGAFPFISLILSRPIIVFNQQCNSTVFALAFNKLAVFKTFSGKSSITPHTDDNFPFKLFINYMVKIHTFRRVTPPPFWYAVFRGGLGGTQYAKGRYAVRKNPVISYADINFYF